MHMYTSKKGMRECAATPVGTRTNFGGGGLAKGAPFGIRVL